MEFITLQDIASVHSGSDFFAAVSSSGRLYTWGSSTYGKLGHGSTTGRNQSIPLLVEDLKDKYVLQVACGAAHCIALTHSEAAPTTTPMYSKEM